MRLDCATGVDNIPNNFIKRYNDILTPIITHICNLSLNQGEFPSAFKKASIHPIHKHGDRDRVNNYRPISILPALSKILEKIVNKRLVQYLESKELLSNSQFGFRRKKSTNDAVHELTNYVITKLDDTKKVKAVFLDLAKAFDTVSVPRLLEKLERLGIRGTQLKFFDSYLKDRTQCVKIDNLYSDELPISYGVPQGSILGPTLFLTYINDLCELQLHNGRIITFADDTALIFYGNSWEEVYQCAQDGFSLVTKWLANNLLTLNIEKTKYISFSLNNRNNPYTQPQYVIPGHSQNNCQSTCSCPNLQHVDKIKYLGVIIDKNLNFLPHIKLLTSRTRKLIYIFKNLRHVADDRVLKMTYVALCQSILTYCISSWGGAAKSHIIALERAQRAVIKVALSLPFFHPTSDLYQKAKVLTVRQLFILQTVIKQHTLVIYDPAQHKNKRRKYKVCVPDIHNTRAAERFFYFLGPHLYNLINSILTIYPLPNKLSKKKVTDWLHSLTYAETEKLLVIPS